MECALPYQLLTPNPKDKNLRAIVEFSTIFVFSLCTDLAVNDVLGLPLLVMITDPKRHVLLDILI